MFGVSKTTIFEENETGKPTKYVEIKIKIAPSPIDSIYLIFNIYLK